MRKILYIFAAAASVVLAAVAMRYCFMKASPAFSEVSEDAPLLFPEINEEEFADKGAYVTRRSALFDDGGEFVISRLSFEEGVNAYEYEIPVSGGDIKIRWQNYESQTYTWEYAEGLEVPKATLFIETSEESAIVSIPALYYERFEHKTLECLPEREQPAVIKETESGYVIQMNFEPIKGTFGEFWYYKSKPPVVEWSAELESLWLRQDLHKNRRFSLDGYYFKTYESYEPYAENGFFRNPANFTGAQIMSGGGGSCVNLGRAMTKICLLNKNKYGFWETGPKSEWLYEDYGIGYDFYDTRFSTDFARSLVYAYVQFGDEEFLEGAIAYAGFLKTFAEGQGYTGGVVGDGVLIPDYWSEEMDIRPHVSLNHQLNEINFLLELYIATKNVEYKDFALKLLRGIENTEPLWILPDGNLKYALMYDESKTQLYDYPYLTYNDLHDTRRLLNAVGEDGEALARLMESKKEWMDKNGVTGYKK